MFKSQHKDYNLRERILKEYINSCNTEIEEKNKNMS